MHSLTRSNPSEANSWGTTASLVKPQPFAPFPTAVARTICPSVCAIYVHPGTVSRSLGVLVALNSVWYLKRRFRWFTPHPNSNPHPVPYPLFCIYIQGRFRVARFLVNRGRQPGGGESTGREPRRPMPDLEQGRVSRAKRCGGLLLSPR